MDYTKIYTNLINTRRNRERLSDVYYELHHIVMKSMGGTDDPENLVLLTPREHFLAHWLLWRIHRNRSTAFAFAMMSRPGNEKSSRNTKFSSTSYAEAKEALSEKMREQKTGRKVSEDTRKKLVEILTRGAARKALTKAMKGKKKPARTDVTKQKIAEAMRLYHKNKM